jgi:intron-binding protein aquarius
MPCYAQALAEGRRGGSMCQSFNVLVRRKPEENNLKAILDSIRALMTTPLAVPDWLQDVLLGYGDPAAYWNLPEQRVCRYDFLDTFLDLDPVRASFPHADVALAAGASAAAPPPYRVTIPPEVGRANAPPPADAAAAAGPRPAVTVEPYDALVAGPYPEDAPRMNPIRFTPVQVEALRAAMNPGLTLVVGPPGTGKTDTAVQILSNLHHTFRQQRTLIITHSNQALKHSMPYSMAWRMAWHGMASRTRTRRSTTSSRSCSCATSTSATSSGWATAKSC